MVSLNKNAFNLLLALKNELKGNLNFYFIKIKFKAIYADKI